MRNIKNIALVAASNSTSILAGIFIGFLIPKILTVTDYGMYKTFTLYMTYVGFFSLGIIDGIVLKYGGVDYQDLDRKDFRAYFAWYNIIHAFFAVLLLVTGLIINRKSLSFLLLMLAANMWAVNITGYFQQLSQITQRFKEFSIRKVLQNTANIIIVALLFIMHYRGVTISYSSYIIAIVLINIILTGWYVYTYNDIVFGLRNTLISTYKEVKTLMQIGFPLLFANILSTLILTLDRQFVNILFDLKIYAVYAFAYNMLSIVTVATSAFSVVLYPALKRTTTEKIQYSYPYFIQIILILVSIALIVYYPLCIIVNRFLPNYIDSLIIFRIVFPGLIISSAITVVMHNYYKTLGKNIVYFYKSIIILVLSAVANIIAYVAFKSVYAISIASILVMLVWYLYVESYFVTIYNYKWKKNFFYMISIMTSFYLATSIHSIIISAFIYLISFLVITVLFYRKQFKPIISIIK